MKFAKVQNASYDINELNLYRVSRFNFISIASEIYTQKAENEKKVYILVSKVEFFFCRYYEICKKVNWIPTRMNSEAMEDAAAANLISCQEHMKCNMNGMYDIC